MQAGKIERRRAGKEETLRPFLSSLPARCLSILSARTVSIKETTEDESESVSLEVLLKVAVTTLVEIYNSDSEEKIDN